MKVIVAKTAGFCFGVKRAVNMVYQELEDACEGCDVYTYGPIIHNQIVLGDLMDKGANVLDSLAPIVQEAMDASDRVVVRSHGIGKEEFDAIKGVGVRVVDATCPFVKRIHKIVERESNNGRVIVIVGNRNHAEVIGIQGWSSTGAIVVESEEEVSKLSFEKGTKLCIVSQTTFNYKKFQELVDIFKKSSYDILVVNTICTATEERQTEASCIAQDVDAMLVIGDLHSSNSKKLYEICKSKCENTYFIQTLDDLNFKLPLTVRSVGITAGASTPNNIIEEVQNYVRINF